MNISFLTYVKKNKEASSHLCYMKIITPILVMLFAFSCQNAGKDLHGEWRVNSKFYSSSCMIFEEDHRLKGLILSYNDGTTRYQHDGSTTRYLFENLKKKDGVFVDAISGATVKAGEQPAISIEQKSKDTLAVTTYIMNHPLTEMWTRK